MLPLSIYFSDEYRLLSRQQLAKSLGQSFALPGQSLTDSWQALKPYLPPLQGHHETEPDELALIDLAQTQPLTAEAANQCFNRYLKHLEQPGPSILLINPADLHPRYEALKRKLIREGVCNRLHALALSARENRHHLILRVPGEETLELTLEILAACLARPDLDNWGHLGICLHTSSKRILPTLGWLEHLGRSLNTRIPIKLISGMPEPEEILNAQQAGYIRYPVLTDPEQCRISHELCQYFLQSPNNQSLHASLLSHHPTPERFEPPPAPSDIFLPIRSNVVGTPAGQTLTDTALTDALAQRSRQAFDAKPLINGASLSNETTRERLNPAQVEQTLGQLHPATEEQVRQAIEAAQDNQQSWNLAGIKQRTGIIQAWAERLQQEQHALIATSIHETGLSVRDAQADLRTAINLCYYYCNQAHTKLTPRTLHGYQNEDNRLELHGRGIYLCLTDHNEPFATAIGQLAALLVSGNTVLLHPDSSCVASLSQAFGLLLEAGLPSGVLAVLPGDARVSQWLLEDYRISGAACFLAPGRTAEVNALLGSRRGAPIIPLLSHSSMPGTQIIARRLSPPEIRALLHSAFGNAGQQRTTLGTLYIEASIADEIEQQLASAMQQLLLGDPTQLETDIGPLSRRDQMELCFEHIERFRLRERVIAQLELGEQHNHGYYVPPTLLRLYTLDELSAPISGPVLHLIRFEREHLPRVLVEINRYCPGQASGLYSHNAALIEEVERDLQASRLLLNCPLSDTSASIHPAGSSGFSGTGPLYGGPNYLMAFVRERATTRRR
ncbi:proline dehydrogenase family protein [Marinobacterium marinum]|uniref:Proline dehydrogenase family protein n=1 Tax=Marinobacterium marinum TaxID=2756129 RepID=A0A7W1WXM8_9GAMM|nr:proline dehydrogenase family protein [Marinobacterium marinum]MBA4502043.1 proline dehydrogenase family protein [Marinobacterium marinum]